MGFALRTVLRRAAAALGEYIMPSTDAKLHVPSGLAYGMNTTGNSNWAADLEPTWLALCNSAFGTTGSAAGGYVARSAVTNLSSNIFKCSTAAGYFPSGFFLLSLVTHSGFVMQNVTTVAATAGTFRLTENSTAATAVLGAEYPYIRTYGVRR